MTRGPVVESRHYGSVAIVDADGRVVGSVGDPDRIAYLRSAAKSAQAAASLATGAADAFGFTDTEVAVMCASHRGQQRHTDAVQSILDKIGLDESALLCGAHAPGDARRTRELAAAGREPTALHNNCSGKHAGMLAACRQLGLDVADYIEPDHPLQQHILATMATLSGVPEGDIATGRDGCGTVTFAMPLRGAATMFSRLAHPYGLPDDLQEAATRARGATGAHPAMVSAPGTFNTELLRAYASGLVAKGGAEGLFGIGFADDGLGIAVKIDDGSARAIPPICIALLRGVDRLGAEQEGALSAFVEPRVRNARKEVVGSIRAAIGELCRAGAL
ncbi:MAG: asparaginase [Armatimonadota bacterium]